MYSKPKLPPTDPEKLEYILGELTKKFPHVTWVVEKAYSPTDFDYIPLEICVRLSHSDDLTDADREELMCWYMDVIPEPLLQLLEE